MNNAALFAPHVDGVGSRVCLGCLDEQRLAERKATRGLVPMPHSFVKGVCRYLDASKKIRYEPGEEAYLAQQKRLDKEVPF